MVSLHPEHTPQLRGNNIESVVFDYFLSGLFAHTTAQVGLVGEILDILCPIRFIPHKISIDTMIDHFGMNAYIGCNYRQPDGHELQSLNTICDLSVVI